MAERKKNMGKVFEKEFKDSVPADCFLERYKDDIVNDLRGYYKTKRVDGKKKSVWVPSILLTDEENTRYCYKIDLHHYYQSINHEVLKQKFRKVFKDPELLWLLDEIADSINTVKEQRVIQIHSNYYEESTSQVLSLFLPERSEGRC